MANIKENVQLVIDHCKELYKHGGATAVIDHVIEQQQLDNSMYNEVKYRHCTPCDAGQPVLDGVCLVCGSNVQPEIGRKLISIGEVKELIKDCDDKDIAVLEACDDQGDVEDLYPMYIDIIDGIELRDGSIVREVRFCQMPNAKPDTRDKQIVIDTVIEQIKNDINDGDTTVLDELLKNIHIELLIHSLPEEQWKNFNKKG